MINICVTFVVMIKHIGKYNNTYQKQYETKILTPLQKNSTMEVSKIGSDNCRKYEHTLKKESNTIRNNLTFKEFIY